MVSSFVLQHFFEKFDVANKLIALCEGVQFQDESYRTFKNIKSMPVLKMNVKNSHSIGLIAMPAVQVNWKVFAKIVWIDKVKSLHIS